MGIARFTPLARNNLKATRDFIALDKPKAASQYMSILKQNCQRLADFPLMGGSVRNITVFTSFQSMTI